MLIYMNMNYKLETYLVSNLQQSKSFSHMATQHIILISLTEENLMMKI